MENKKKTMLELHRVSCDEYKQKEKINLVVVLNDVRSLNNIGSVFRTADAFCINSICLCGITATPPHPDIHKTALGAEMSVNWQYYSDAVECVEMLRSQGYTICSIEQVHGSISLTQFEINKQGKYAVVLGNEVKGVSQEVINHSDCCIELPQYGTKHSLNVSITAGIVMWDFFKALYL
ncbi:MAG: RNA methyltransferase [Muribaculaceae bacterium]